MVNNNCKPLECLIVECLSTPVFVSAVQRKQNFKRKKINAYSRYYLGLYFGLSIIFAYGLKYYVRG